MLVETVYTLIVLFSALYTAMGTHRLAVLSSHPGIRAFRNAFLLYAIGFTLRWSIFFVDQFGVDPIGIITLQTIRNFFLTAGGFMLVYSLVWKGHAPWQAYLLHGAAIIVAIGDIFIPHLMFVTQVAAMLYALILVVSAERRISQLYVTAIGLALIAYLTNFLAEFILPVFPWFIYYVYLITASAFVIIAYAVFTVVQWPRSANVSK